MADPYSYGDVPVLWNTLNIKDEKTLNLVEEEQSRANMMFLYEQGFHDFTPEGLQSIHRFLFGDLYDWAGKFRIINIAKREKLLAGQSVWYSNDEAVPDDLTAAFQDIQCRDWKAMVQRSLCVSYIPMLCEDLADTPFPRGQHQNRGYDADILCRALQLLHGSGTFSGKRRLCA